MIPRGNRRKSAPTPDETRCLLNPWRAHGNRRDFPRTPRETRSPRRDEIRSVLGVSMELEHHQIELRYEALRLRDPAREARLTASLLAEGQRHPVLVFADSATGFVLVDGYRRVRALRSLGRDAVAAMDLGCDEVEAMMRAWRLAGGRRLEALEEAWLVRELLGPHGLGQRELGRRMGRTASWVCRRLARPWPCERSGRRTSASHPTTPTGEVTMKRSDDELDQLLATLRLRRVASILERDLARAEKTHASYRDFLVGLLREEVDAQREQRVVARIRRAKIPERWTLETFPFERQLGVPADSVKQLAELDFIAQHRNVVLIGPTGTGKTGIASSILLKALENGYRCLFVKAQDLFDELYTSMADRSSRKLLDHLARLDVLLIDEMGYLNLRPEQTNLFFKLMEERYNRHSTVITTNLEYDAWYDFLGRKEMVGALLDRLRHRCTTIRIAGDSLRSPEP
ncbi:MAG: ATP-binding protein [Deltaproteobacteria bacterium]|nr:ATP-binding protein [Deltaproteobacteria bacterium]